MNHSINLTVPKKFKEYCIWIVAIEINEAWELIFDREEDCTQGVSGFHLPLNQVIFSLENSQKSQRDFLGE